MKKAIRYASVILILAFFFTLSSTSFAKNPEVAPHVSIVTPIEHAVVTTDALDVFTWFHTKDKGQANVLYLKLELDGEEVAIYRNEANLKEANHIFRKSLISYLQ